MALTGNEFNQFSFAIENRYEPKYKNRFVLHIETIPMINSARTGIETANATQTSGLLLSLSTAKRPQYTVEEKEIKRFNEKAFYAGTPSMDNKMDCEFFDYINNQGATFTTGASAASILYRWFNTVYNINQGSQGFKKDYSTKAHLYLLDPTGGEVEHWHYTNFWIASLDFGDLTYEGSDIAKITASFKYDKARLIENSDTAALTSNTYLTNASTTPKAVPNPLYTPNGASSATI
jgi:hypothetical protein